MVGNPADVCRQEALHHGGRPEDWRRLTLHAYSEVVPALDRIVEALEAAGYSVKDTFGVRLALEEALVNAIKHGHRGDPSKSVQLRYRYTAECVLAEVEDEGPGFHPEEVPDPLAPENLDRDCGRGLLLMRTYMTCVRYNAAGTCVTLCKHRAGA